MACSLAAPQRGCQIGLAGQLLDAGQLGLNIPQDVGEAALQCAHVGDDLHFRLF